MEKKVLITGAGGFIGKNLIEGLDGKYKILSPSHRELDLLDENSVEKYLRGGKPDIIIHCAAVGVSRKNNTAEAGLANLRMFANLSRCHYLYGKMIFLGSGAEYDKRRDLARVKEGDFNKTVPSDSYGFYKYLCSLIIESARNIVNLRLFAVFGKYEDYEARFISNTICRSLFGFPVVINQDVKFDYFSVKDLVRVVDFFIENQAKEKFYNVGSGRSVSLSEIVAKVEKLSGKKIEVSIKAPGFNKEYSCDNARLLSEMPGFSFSPFDEAVAELYNWYTVNKSSINKDKLFFDK
jgi:GDP-L-fucose synthase